MNAICVFITLMPCKKKIENIDNQRLEFTFHEKQIFLFKDKKNKDQKTSNTDTSYAVLVLNNQIWRGRVKIEKFCCLGVLPF